MFSELEQAIAPEWNPVAHNPVCHNPVCHIVYNRDAWVKLLQPPSAYAADEAQLLCQTSANTWLTWVPNHGELMLTRSDFYC